ncbi:MAG: E2/UBC family protein [Dehalococcoidia bacterium]
MGTPLLSESALIQEGDELLPEDDVKFLKRKGYSYRAQREASSVLLVILGFVLPDAYTPSICDLLIVLPAGYPGGNPDMFWTTPGISLVRGGGPLTADHIQAFLGRSWQRWSRHYQTTWRSGIDGLETYMGAVRSELMRGL